MLHGEFIVTSVICNDLGCSACRRGVQTVRRRRGLPAFPVARARCRSRRLGGTRLTSDLAVSDVNTTGIELGSSDITLDLNGFSNIRADCVGVTTNCGLIGTKHRVGRTSPNYRGLTVKNGSVVGMGGNGAPPPPWRSALADRLLDGPWAHGRPRDIGACSCAMASRSRPTDRSASRRSGWGARRVGRSTRAKLNTALTTAAGLHRPATRACGSRCRGSMRRNGARPRQKHLAPKIEAPEACGRHD